MTSQVERVAALEQRLMDHESRCEERLAEIKTSALAMGFHHVESGPLVRSSYHAWEHVGAN